MAERLPQVLTEEEWRAFIRQFSTRCPTGLRNRAVFTLLHDAGLRTAEALDLQLQDIRRDGDVTGLLIRGKGGRERWAWLTEEAQRLLDAWLEKRRELGLGQRKYVFVTLKGGRLDSGYVREVCARKGHEAGLPERAHPHALRHTFATDLLEREKDLALVQDALGHRDPKTTRVYARVRNARLKEAMTRKRDEQAAQLVQALRDLPAEVKQKVAAALLQETTEATE